MKTLIVGRTGTGKDTLKETLEKDYGWKFVKSYTTREPRYDNEDTHIFITHDEAKSFKDSDKVASTLIKNNTDIPDEYFATFSQVREADAYIIDPIGVDKLIKNMPDTVFEILYITAPDKETQKNMAIGRADNPDAAKSVFEKRYESEDKQFTDFENSIKSETFGADNCNIVIQTTNNYTKEWLKAMAFTINSRKQYYRNMNEILNDLINAKILIKDNNNKIKVYTDKGIKAYTIEEMSQSLIMNPQNLGYITQNWLKMPNTALSDFTKEKDSNILNIKLKNYLYDLMQPMVEEGEFLDDKINNIIKERIDDNNFYQMLDEYFMPLIKKQLNK